jgi:hypothetical protein
MRVPHDDGAKGKKPRAKAAAAVIEQGPRVRW